MSIFAYVPPSIWGQFASLPAILPRAAAIGAGLFCALAAGSAASLVRGWRRLESAARRDRAWRIGSFLALGAALPFVAARLLDVAYLRDQPPSLNVALTWLVLALPALFQAPRAQGVRWAKWISLALADLAAGGLLARLASKSGLEINFAVFAGFVALTHVAVAFDVLARGAGRRVFWPFAALVAMLFLAADFFVSPAVAAGGRAQGVAAIRTIAMPRGECREAFFNSVGDAAYVLTDRGRLKTVRLANGESREFLPATTPPIRRLAVDPAGRSVDAAFGPAAPIGLAEFFAGGLQPMGAYRGNLPFAADAMATSQAFVIAAGDGPRANARICAAFNFDFGATKPAVELCRDLHLPMGRVGSLTATSTRGLFYAAEGDRWLAEGTRLVTVRSSDGALCRMETVGPGIGGLAIDGVRSALFVARPRVGTIEVRATDTLRPVGLIRGEPGDDLLAFDGGRNLLLAANPRSGYLNIYDSTRGKRVAHAPIGPGIAHLDYLGPAATALLCAERGLVTVKITELPEMLSP